MLNKKGFTIFEMLIGFIFLIMISYFLLTTIFSVRDRQEFTIIKSDLVDLKNSLTEEINYDLVRHKFLRLDTCGTHCFDLRYSTGLVRRLEVNIINNWIKYGDSEYSLVEDSFVKTPYEVRVLVINNTLTNRNNSLLVIDIPIEHKEISGSFGININSPFNVHQQATPITMTLSGSSTIDITLGGTYTELGATANSPNGGNITDRIKINNSVNVSRVGTYTVIYEATDNLGFIGVVTRTIRINSSTPVANFVHTAAIQTYTVPTTGRYRLEVWGAQGGTTSGFSNNGTAGRGGYVVGEINLTAGQVLNVYVGGQGTNRTNLSANLASGGFNGGGSGFCSTWCGTNGGAGGGGATDIRIGGTALTNRIIVAGGGGGAYGSINSGCHSNGGPGGGLNGLDGRNACSGKIPGVGGKSNRGGSGSNLIAGSLGLGGNANSTSCGAGGGGGNFGGSSGHNGCNASSGGGGSSFMGTLLNAQTIAGNNLMPIPAGGTQIGHGGHGHVRITHIATQ